MKSVVAFRPLRPGVSVEDYWRAVGYGTRESVLGNPAPMPVAVYDQLRALERELGKRGVDPAGPEVEEFRAHVALWEREWREAEPCGPDGAALANAASVLPLSPLERRQRHPKVRAAPRERQAQACRNPRHKPVASEIPPVRVPRRLRLLVDTRPGAEWWRLQGLRLGSSPPARAAYAAALRELSARDAENPR